MSDRVFDFPFKTVGEGDIRKARAGICPYCENRSLRDISVKSGDGEIDSRQCNICKTMIVLNIISPTSGSYSDSDRNLPDPHETL